ncbi:MAG: ATP--guanido phosphotransferase [Clostridia bacterium]|nr:ATP--guanido phosphotransferase [Clostridia bacterium]
MAAQTILSSRVRLARNYEDLPFDAARRDDTAAMCIARTSNALKLSGTDGGFILLRLRDMERVQRESLVESHLITRDLNQNPENAAVLLNMDEGLSIMMNEEDHLRIQAMSPGMNLQQAADRCFAVEDALSRQVTFAFDPQLGYLTACPTNTGTGMRASLLMHLPMLTLCKQMGNVGQIVAKVGLTIRGVYGEGAEALGNLYQVSNQVTLGRTEQELISAVTAVGHQLTDMESALWDKTWASSRITLEDSIYRAWGIMRHARVMPMNEFYKHWSALRMGAVRGVINLPAARLDALLDQAQDAHVQAYAEEHITGSALDEARATRIRTILSMDD